MDALLKGKWEGMKTKLIAGDVKGAVGYFADKSKDSFRQQFTILSSILSQIVSEMGEISLIKVKDNYAEYDLRTVRDNTTYSFQLLFVRDTDGIWRIRSF